MGHDVSTELLSRLADYRHFPNLTAAALVQVRPKGDHDEVLKDGR